MQSSFYTNIHHQENVTESLTTTPDLVLNQTSDWGPTRDPLYIVIPITIIYVVIFLSGILGNISTCIVIARNKCMHTATNYYLFSLAVSDLLLLVSGLPPEVYSIWSKYPYVFGEAFCVLQGLTAETSANATVLTITAFTVERYVAICHPFLSHTLSKLNRAIKYIILIWAIAIGLAIPQAMAFGIVCEVLANGYIVEDHCVCMIKREIIPHNFLISTLLFFVAPMSLITVLYIFIGLQLRKSTVGPSRGSSIKMKHQKVYKPVVAYVHPSTQVLVMNRGDEMSQQQQYGSQQEEVEGRKNFAKNAQATKHVVKMLVAVVVAFFICWAPFHAQRLLAIYGGSEDTEKTSYMILTFQILTYISGIFYYLSTTVNPLLYHIMSNKFREAFKKTYKHVCRKGHKQPVGRCYSTLSAHHQSYSDSYSGGGWGGGCGGGGTRGTSLRRLEDAVAARLHDHRRPLVVSFRRQKRTPQSHQGEVVEGCISTERTANGLAQSVGSPLIGITKKRDSEGTVIPPTKMKTSFSFSSPLLMDKLIIEKSRSFTKDRPTSESDFRDVMDYLHVDENQSGNVYQDKNGYACRSTRKNLNSITMSDSQDRPERVCSYVEVHTLRPKHICPLNKNILEVN